MAHCPIYASWKSVIISIDMHIYVAIHFISLKAMGETSGPFYWHGSSLILAWISNYIHWKLELNYFSIAKI